MAVLQVKENWEFHPSSSSLLPNTQIVLFPFSFSNLNLLRNAQTTPGSLQAPSQAAWLGSVIKDKIPELSILLC